MTREELAARIAETIAETHDALQTVADELNQGQRKKLAKVDAINKLFKRYGVKIGDE